MVGKANRGHSCVKGRFAWGYTTHKERILKPMIREKISEPWREVSWDEAFSFAAAKVKAIQAKYGRDSVGGITSSRCTNEETYLVQKLVRAAFGNNNVDTCARVCHSPTGYGLKNTLGESAGTQAFDSVMQADVVMIIGANPRREAAVLNARIRKRWRAGWRRVQRRLLWADGVLADADHRARRAGPDRLPRVLLAGARGSAQVDQRHLRKLVRGH